MLSPAEWTARVCTDYAQRALDDGTDTSLLIVVGGEQARHYLQHINGPVPREYANSEMASVEGARRGLDYMRKPNGEHRDGGIWVSPDYRFRDAPIHVLPAEAASLTEQEMEELAEQIQDIRRRAGDEDPELGMRHLAGWYGSELPGVACTGVVSSVGSVVVFEGGELLDDFIGIPPYPGRTEENPPPLRERARVWLKEHFFSPADLLPAPYADLF